jgi:hypothetical protein
MLRTPKAARSFKTLFHVEKVAHGDTVNDVLCALPPEDMQEAVCVMIEALLRKRVLEQQRLLGMYYVIAVDGTGTLTFKERHCPHCLTRTQDGKTTYYHNVLEAKLVAPNGFALSIMSEFVENPTADCSKQDCELKAFYRLAEQLKQRFPRLRIAMALDALFACGPVFALCRRHDWRFIIGLKDLQLSSVNEEFQALRTLEPGNQLIFNTGKKAEIRQEISWANDIDYKDTNGQTHDLAVLQCIQTRPAKEGKQETKTTFRWLTNISITSKNAVTLANEGGRLRWKIENEGFNTQKNGGYRLEHAYTRHPEGIKVYYYLLQMACIINQLIERGSLLKAAFPRGFGSAKNIAWCLLEAWRNQPLLEARLAYINTRCQIRFDSS